MENGRKKFIVRILCGSVGGAGFWQTRDLRNEVRKNNHSDRTLTEIPATMVARNLNRWQDLWKLNYKNTRRHRDKSGKFWKRQLRFQLQCQVCAGFAKSNRHDQRNIRHATASPNRIVTSQRRIAGM